MEVLLDSLKQTVPHADVLFTLLTAPILKKFALLIASENNHLWFTESLGNSLRSIQTLAQRC